MQLLINTKEKKIQRRQSKLEERKKSESTDTRGRILWLVSSSFQDCLQSVSSDLTV